MNRLRFTTLSIATFSGIVLCQSIAARQLTPGEAFENALGYSLPTVDVRKMNINGGAVQSNPALAYTVETENAPTVYVFSKSTGGFWVVAADDAVSNGLLGYTDGATFRADSIPQNIASLLEFYGEQVAQAAASENETFSSSSAATAANRRAITPILSTRWGQTDAYSTFTPMIDGVHCPTGCVATAMGQVMYAYKYPSAGTGSIRYKATTLGEYLEYYFEENAFDWEGMESTNGTAAGAKNPEAVAQLLHACGMATKMNYGKNASGSSYATASRAMVDYLGYDKGMALMSHEYFGDDEWEGMLYDELESGRPVMYCGKSTTAGSHAFICDGYDGNGYYHINWGWDGCYDGYYRLTLLDPNQNGAGFTSNISMIIGIQPARENSIVRPVLTFVGDFTFEADEIARNPYSSLKVMGPTGIFNNSVGAVTVTLGLKFVDEDGNVTYGAASSEKKLIAAQGFTSYQVRHSAFPKTGRYRVTPAARDENGTWHDMYINRSREAAYYVDCSSTELIFTPESEVLEQDAAKDIQVTHLAVKSGVVSSGESFEVEAHFGNSSIKKYSRQLIPTLMADGVTVATGTMINVEISAKGNLYTEWLCELDAEVEAGAYTMALLDSKGNTYGSPIDVEVVDEDGEIAPFTDDFTPAGIDEIGGDENEEIVFTEIYNLQGQLVATVSDLTMHDFQKGVYILRHHLANGTESVEKKIFR